MAQTWLSDERNTLLILLGPDEPGWLEQPATAEIASHPRVEIMNGSSLINAATALASCDAVVTNDSGLLHLSETVGTPVVALFGPTVQAFGYAPLLPNSRLLEVDLDCRPCSRTGSRPCHRGDLACLEAITPEAVLQAVNDILAPDAEAGQ
jgi:heptosyltransferase-2